MKKVIIVGKTKEERELVADFIAPLYNHRKGAKYIRECVIWPQISKALEYSDYMRMMYSKNDDKKLWDKVLTKFKEANKVELALSVLQVCGVYKGMTSIEELDEIRALTDEHFVIWVGSRGESDAEVSDGFTISPSDCDMRISSKETGLALAISLIKGIWFKYRVTGFKSYVSKIVLLVVVAASAVREFVK